MSPIITHFFMFFPEGFEFALQFGHELGELLALLDILQDDGVQNVWVY